jgi:hypothetical protein
MANDDTADNLGEIFSTINNLDRGANNDFPLDMQQIMLVQVKDSDLQRRIMSKKFVNNIATINIDGNVVTRKSLGSKRFTAENCQMVLLKSTACGDHMDNQHDWPNLYLERTPSDGQKTHHNMQQLPTQQNHQQEGLR